MAAHKFTSIDSTGVAALTSRPAGAASITVQNIGTVPIEVYYNADGSGDPDWILVPGDVNDDGRGQVLADDWSGAVYLKAPSGTGRAIVRSY